MLLLRISVIATSRARVLDRELHFLYISNGTFVLFSAVVAPEFATWRNFIFFSTQNAASSQDCGMTLQATSLTSHL